MFKKNSIFHPQLSTFRGVIRSSNAIFCAIIALLFTAAFSGCQTIPALPPVNLSQPGWHIRHGQAVWRREKNAPEITGDLLVAINPDGRSFVQFTKTPLPFVMAQTTSNSWQINFVPANKIYSARGNPPARIVWFQLARFLAGAPPPKNWKWENPGNGGFRLDRPSTGESLEGYLTP